MTGLFLLLITAVGLLGCIAFVVAYVRQAGWKIWFNEEGSFLLVVYLNLGTLFMLGIINSIFGDWPGRTVISLVLYMTYAIEAWWPLRLLLRRNRDARVRARMEVDSADQVHLADSHPRHLRPE